jgi:hypothetical protein
LLIAIRVEAAPSGYFVDSSQVSAPRPIWVADTTGDFSISIRRSIPDSLSERLLAIAEATYPPRELLIRIAAGKGYEMGSDTAGAVLWWCEGLGASRVPYAVTAGALDHYTGLTELYRERRFREAGTRPLFWSELVYRATIAFRDTFNMDGASYSNVFVAHLRLVWTYDDGTFLPFTKAHRVVVLTHAGEVLAVHGDGATEEKLSISRHRGIGRQERIWR